MTTLRYTHNSRRVVRDFVSSLDFTGSSGVVSIGTGNPFTSSFYIGQWIYWAGINSNFHTLMAKRDSYAASGLMFSMSINPSGVLTMDTVTSFITFAYTFPINTWTHMLWTHNTSDKLYINGQLYITRSLATLGTKTDAAITIGSTQSADYFYGKIGASIIGTGAVSDDEAFALYTTYSSPGTVYRNFLLNEGSGTTAIDSSINATNATISGVSYSTNAPIKSRTVSS